MAGGKETPRQKMIGMMYLVLTALLALNVNSAILLKFKFLDDALFGVNQKTDKSNQDAVKGIEKAVADNRNQARDRAVLAASQKVRERTAQMVSSLRDMRDQLMKASKNTPEKFENLEATEAVANLMLGSAGNKKGLGYKLQNDLNQYATDLQTLVPGVTVPKLALDAKEDPAVTAEQKTKDFAQLNFEQTPVAAALAVLSQKETEVLKYESDALNRLAQQVGASNIVFDKIGAFASAESNTVAAGTKYKAELFLTASASGLNPTMTLNGSPLRVDPATGKGKIEFTAKPGGFDQAGNAKASWTGTIRFKQNGRDTLFTVKTPYTITKPVMQIQSASVQALYFKCGNKLSVQVPALGAQYDPSFSASGAATIKGSAKGEVTLVPNSREVTLNVSSNGNAIGSQVFQVRQIPKPDIQCWVGGRPANEKQGTPITAVRNMNLKAIPDASFASFLPEDARFRVSSYQITLVRGKRPAIPTRTINGPNADLTDVVNSAREGDRLYIEVKGVQRQNFQGNVEDVNVSKQFNIPLL